MGRLAVLFGAFGAHTLKKILSDDLLKSFETGVTVPTTVPDSADLQSVLTISIKNKFSKKLQLFTIVAFVCLSVWTRIANLRYRYQICFDISERFGLHDKNVLEQPINDWL